MPRYTLMAPHYAPGDVYLPAGAQVGDGTPFPWTGPPSMHMEGADDAGCDAIRKLKRVDPITGMPIGKEDQRREARMQRAGDRSADDPGPGGDPNNPGPLPPVQNNPIYPTYPNVTQPIIPAPSEHLHPSAVARPDSAKTPEERQRDHDAAVGAAAKSPQHVTQPKIADGKPGATQPDHPAASKPSGLVPLKK